MSTTVESARILANSAIIETLSPLVQEYESAFESVSTSQKKLSDRLETLLNDLRRVASTSANEPDPGSPGTIGGYVRKIESLRKRLDVVNYSMSRVSVRLESLQTAVSNTERATRMKAAAAAATAAIEGVSVSQ
jgi:prefoldin subunit 5